MRIRLNKYIADCGIASRRQADQMIAEGAFQVNGKTTYELGVQVDPDEDRITLNGKPIKPPTTKVYLAFYKPEGILTSTSDPEGRPTVMDFVKDVPFRVFPVGRLDWDTEGLLLLTNDGDYSQQVTHPKFEIPKTYIVKISGKISDAQMQKLRMGVTIPNGGRVKAIHIEKIDRPEENTSGKYDWVKIVIGEGKNRQVRLMFQKIGFDVRKLKRVAIGKLTLGPIKKGQFAYLDLNTAKRVFERIVSHDKNEKKNAKNVKGTSTKNPKGEGKFARKKQTRNAASKTSGRRSPSSKGGKTRQARSNWR